MLPWARRKKYEYVTHSHGFTIVELLIVIVVIGILAAIVIVSYSGIQANARVAAVQSDLDNVHKVLANDNVLMGSYPATLAAANNGKGIASVSDGTSWVYSYYSATNSYCLTGTRGATTQSMTSLNPSIMPVDCNSLVGWWPMDGDSIDASGGGNDATPEGGASLSYGQNGSPNRGYALSGSTTQALGTQNKFALNTFTASIWVNPDDTGPSSFDSLMSNSRDCCSTNSGFQIDYTKTSPYSLRGRLWAGGSGAAASLSYDGLSLNTWNFVALTYDGTTLRLFKNGQQVGSASYTSGGSLGTPVYNLAIGRMGYSSSGYSVGGLIDDARIYNRALSGNEIQTLYNTGAQ